MKLLITFITGYIVMGIATFFLLADQGLKIWHRMVMAIFWLIVVPFYIFYMGNK